MTTKIRLPQQSSHERDELDGPPTIRNTDRDRARGEIVAGLLCAITFGMVDATGGTSGPS